MEELGQINLEPEPDSIPCSKHAMNNLDRDYLMAPCYVKMCRICFATDGKMHSLIDFKGLNEAYENLSGIMTADEEHLPRYLCVECANRLMNCARFRRRSLRAHLMLLDIVKRHGCITVELVKSILEIHKPFDSDVENYRIDDFGFDNEDLEDVDIVNKSTAERDTRLKNIDVCNNINYIKVEIDNVDNVDTHVNSEDITNDLAVNEVKKENSDVKNHDDFNAGSCNLEEEIMTDNDMIKQNSDVCSNNLMQDSVDDINIINDGSIYEDVNEESVANKRLLCSAGLDEDAVTNDIKMEYRDDINESSPNDEKSCAYKKYGYSNVPEDADSLKIEEPSLDHNLHCDMYPHKSVSDSQLLENLKTPDVSKKTYYCDVCDYQTDRKNKLHFHNRTHIGDKVYSCDVCKKVFKYKGSVKLHMRIHSGEKPYSCNICTKSFTLKHHLQHHLLKHSGEKPYSCDVCNKAFSVKQNLQQHLVIHSAVKPYSCDLCKKGFRKKQHLRSHLITHSGEKPYSCDICRKGFRHKYKLKSHLIIHSSAEQYSCNICKRTFIQKEQLLSHLPTHTDEKPYSCDICKKSFRHKYLLKSHILKQSGGNYYSCNICRRAFRQKEQLLTHLPIHSDEKPYACDTCSKAFRHQYLLKSHLLVHSGEKPHTCDICKKSFRKKDQLRKHSRIHSGVKPYTCDICGKAFRHKYLLKSHLLIHTGEKPYSCDICGNKFRLQRGLKAHLIIHSSK